MIDSSPIDSRWYLAAKEASMLASNVAKATKILLHNNTTSASIKTDGELSSEQVEKTLNDDRLEVCHELAVSIYWLFCWENELSTCVKNVRNERLAKGYAYELFFWYFMSHVIHA